jgi:hypothetical protein
MFNSLFGKKPQKKSGPVGWEPAKRSPLSHNSQPSGASFTKVFRWRLPEGKTEAPNTVEIVGSFTKWQRVPLSRDGVLDAWHVTVHNIPSHQTHHYVLLLDGEPAQDKNCDGMAPPRGPDEERYTVQTDRGPRVCMLFSQTK